MSGDELTILREIRDEIRSTRVDLGSRIDGTNQRLDVVDHRLDVVDHRLESVDHRLESVDHRLELVAADITKLATQQILTNRYVKNDSSRQDEAIEDLRHRVDALEKLP